MVYQIANPLRHHTRVSSLKRRLLTTIAHTGLTKKGATKRRGPTIIIAVAALAAIVLIGILVYPSSQLIALFVSKNSEVVVPSQQQWKTKCNIRCSPST